MSEEEKQAIETMQTIVNFGGDNLLSKEHRRRLQIVLNLIDKQQKEIEEKCKKYVDLCFEAGKTKADLDIAERVIDKMAENIFTFIEDGVFVDDIEYLKLENETEVKEYFYKEIENE